MQETCAGLGQNAADAPKGAGRANRAAGALERHLLGGGNLVGPQLSGISN
jgi:hypothetical protein